MKKNIYRKKTNPLKYLGYLLVIAMIGSIGFISLSPQFEQNKPNIEFKGKLFWNLKTKLQLKLTDDSGIKYYKITYSDGSQNIELDSKVLDGSKKEIIVDVKAPKFDMFYKGDSVSLNIEVIDNSKWNYLNGNVSTKKIDLKIDIKKPLANIIENTRYIRRGGSALVIVKVEDENLEKAYLMFNNEVKFKLRPFYKDNYFISLIAWDVNIEDFKKVNLIAFDKAGNKTISKVPLYIQPLRIKKDTINISSHFIESVSSSVLEQSGEAIPVELSKRFIAQNKELRKKNVDFLRKIGVKHMDKSKIDNFNIKIFRRLRGSRTAAGYAERRSYLYNGEKIDEEWHLGMDWASIRKATIKTSNAGKVIFDDYLGIYGNTIVIDHGLGLASLYAHTSSTNVEVSEEVRVNQKIANTGSTGAVMGDHLHFGILVQGIEVNPLEWMDRNWIKNNITKVISKAKKSIDSN